MGSMSSSRSAKGSSALGTWQGIFFCEFEPARAHGLYNKQRHGLMTHACRPPRPPTKIEVDGLSKRFGKTQAVAELSFRVEPGTVTGFLGPNGAGKSTTLRSVLGLVHPDRGRATVLGVPYRRSSGRSTVSARCSRRARCIRAGLGRNHLRVLAAAAGSRDARRRGARLVELTRPRRRVKGYSLGMRQRLGLATALLGDPEVLVLDEPANGLDPAGIRWLRDFLRRSLPRGGRSSSPATSSPRSRRPRTAS